MEENTTKEVVVASTEPMNPTNQPVSFYGDNSRNTDSALLASLATKTYDYPGMCAADGVSDLRSEVKDAECNLRHDINKAESEIRRDVAKAEADIRAEVLREGQDNLKATMAAECNLSKEILESRHLLNSEIIKQGYENKILQKDTVIALNEKFQHLSERLGDKVDHGFEEVNEKLCECCCEQELAAASIQQGIVNIQNLLQNTK